MTQLPPRPAVPDPLEEHLIAMLREELRKARTGSRGIVQAEITVEGGRIVAGWVLPARRHLDGSKLTA